MRTINKQQLTDIAHGACLLGSGGGGGLDTALNMIDTSMTESDEIPMVTVEEAAADRDRLTCVPLFAGSPKSGHDAPAFPAIKALEEMNEICWSQLQKEIGYAVPLEMGAVNTIVPFLAAKEMGLATKSYESVGKDSSGRRKTVGDQKRMNPSGFSHGGRVHRGRSAANSMDNS